MKTTVLLGKGELAVRAAGWLARSADHDLGAVVPVVPEPTWTTSLIDWCRTNEVPFVETGNHEDLPLVLDRPVDLAISVFYDRIIPGHFIDRCSRIVNLHNGPLPRYRGVSPINWALKNRESTHGVTIHEITPGIDDGPIWAQVLFSVYPTTDEVIDVVDRALEFGWALFQTTIPLLDRITPVEQDHGSATYYSRRDDHALGDRRDFTRASSLTPDPVSP